MMRAVSNEGNGDDDGGNEGGEFTGQEFRE